MVSSFENVLPTAAQSDFGRALKIGGRKPEWLSDAEYAYQQSRSAHLRMEELTDMGIGALSSVPGMAAGVMTPGVGWAIGVGIAVLGMAMSIFSQKLIDDITKIISHYSDINYDLIKSNYLEKKRSRLEK